MTEARTASWLLAFALCCSITLTNQWWVGRMSIYGDDQAARRESLHYAVLANRLPEGASSWDSIGANGSNIRLLTVWVAEGLRRATGQSVDHVYLVIETGAVLLSLLLLVAFLESRVGMAFALIGLLYVGSVLPLTYLFHYFHPWDKPSLCAWLAALMCVERRKWVSLAVVLAIGMFIKYDIILFPLFVLFADLGTGRRRSAVLITAGLMSLTVSIYFFLGWLAPGGLERRDWLALITRNLSDAIRLGPRYPPLLGLGIPAALAAFGYSSSDAFAKAGVKLALVICAVLFVQTYFSELRAELPLLVLLLPAAAAGVERLFGGSRLVPPASTETGPGFRPSIR